jgi:SH3 domain protein
MKNLNVWFWMVLIGTLILPAASRAETVYVSEEFEITMRTGPGNDRKIISLTQYILPSTKKDDISDFQVQFRKTF